MKSANGEYVSLEFDILVKIIIYIYKRKIFFTFGFHDVVKDVNVLLLQIYPSLTVKLSLDNEEAAFHP